MLSRLATNIIDIDRIAIYFIAIDTAAIDIIAIGYIIVVTAINVTAINIQVVLATLAIILSILSGRYGHGNSQCRTTSTLQ